MATYLVKNTSDRLVDLGYLTLGPGGMRMLDEHSFNASRSDLDSAGLEVVTQGSDGKWTQRVSLSGAAPKKTTPAPVRPSSKPKYSEWTKSGLKEELDDRGIEYSTTATKNKLIALLEANDE